MFIRKSKHLQIIENIQNSYERKEYYQEQKITKLQTENDKLRVRLNKALDELSSEEQKLIDYVSPKVTIPSR